MLTDMMEFRDRLSCSGNSKKVRKIRSDWSQYNNYWRSTEPGCHCR